MRSWFLKIHWTNGFYSARSKSETELIPKFTLNHHQHLKLFQLLFSKETKIWLQGSSKANEFLEKNKLGIKTYSSGKKKCIEQPIKDHLPFDLVH